MPNTNLTVGDKDPEETNFLTPVILDMRRRLQFSSVQFSSVQFSHSVVSDSLQPHGLQHARSPCP